MGYRDVRTSYDQVHAHTHTCVPSLPAATLTTMFAAVNVATACTKVSVRQSNRWRIRQQMKGEEEDFGANEFDCVCEI